METWDLFDSTRQPLFRTHRRGEKIPPGEYHTVIEVWTVDSNKNVLVTLRDPNKEEYPNKWENTGGSALAGESSKQAAVRELHEETGIIAAEDELSLLGTYKEPSAFIDIYLLRRDISISQLTMQEGETVAAKWVTLQQLDTMIDDETLALPTGKRLASVRKAFQKHLDLF